jgi:ABC-type antimicrobial peptide transport system ATPase subunit
MTAPEHPYTRALLAAAFDLAAVPAEARHSGHLGKLN